MKKMASRYNLGGKAPRCPLCHDWMEKSFEHHRGFFIFACHFDKIAIRVDDPFVGRWDVALEKNSPDGIPCPRPGCETKMRYFATATGFMKAICPQPKCGASITNAEPDRVKDTVYTPEAPGVLQ